MSIDRQTIRRFLLRQIVELSEGSGSELLAKVREGDWVRQIHICREPDIALNVRVEIAPDQSGCPDRGVRLWINVNDFQSIEAAELVVVDQDVLIGDTVKSLGG